MPDRNILFVTRKWAPAIGGMETYCLRLTEALAMQDSLEVIALRGRANGMPPRITALAGFFATALVRCLWRRDPPRVLHLGDMVIWPLAIPALVWRGTKIVLSAHGTDVAYHRRGGVKGGLYSLYQRLGARLLRKASVIANSQATSAAAEELGWTVPAIVSLATDLTAIDRPEEHDGSILFAGRLIERKGCRWFVREVLPLLPSDLRLKVAGTAWNAAEAEILADPRVDFLGGLPQDQLALAYARALCVIVPNIDPPNGEFEGFGLVACEAAACGGLVLAARTGGLPDAVIDGQTGFLLPPGDASAWAEMILEIADWPSDVRYCFIETALQAVETHYRWDRVARETRAAYDLERPERLSR